MNPRRYINHREGQTGWMRESKTETTPAPPLGEFLGRLRSRNQDMYFPEKTDGSQEHVGISDVELIASYNWVKKSSPTIIVPGEYKSLAILDGTMAEETHIDETTT